MSPIFDVSDGTPVELGEGRGDLRSSSVPFVPGEWDGGAFFGSMPVSYAKIFATQPWVYIAVMRLLTWAVRVPLKLYRREDDEGARTRLRPQDHPLAAALASPWDRGSQADLIQELLGPLCIHGNDLTDVQQGARNKIRFEPLDWRTVAPIRLDESDPNADIVGWNIYRPHSKDRRSSDTVMHLRWYSPLGKLGLSPLQALRSTLTSESAAVAYAINNLKQGARPDGVVEMTDEAVGLNAEDRKRLFEDALERMAEYSGEQNAGKTPVMPPGMKWTTATHTTAVEAELMAQRLVNRSEVGVAYMIPPPMIGQLERSTFNNLTMLREMAYTDGLAPPLVLIEQTITAHVIEGLLREPDLFCEFDLGLILRGDRLKEIQALRQGVSGTLYTPNEARGALNMPPSKEPAADELFYPGNNLQPLRSAAKEASSATA